ncbi:Procollagen-lysine,2-oxoglutarate 5-dioxygenase [Hondaea fermentalgiana]|uniref:Procollagen-lysine,2-oxoglutarate 5-dioxygenase n=1 Tax=Hondaea fermentalgiana TaxID=2315210 RepID=A0A2R5G999_9STRA|nr:Procollagen-lysine,2-oxoglutarate 5-dioxygenase [Hondaea fermentalgiana]|eukprot:GBG27626.1 Procollagen-lysine,2-oxoglutarate 5-dioxygenase [Hondaea fermentalgiana]
MEIHGQDEDGAGVRVANLSAKAGELIWHQSSMSKANGINCANCGSANVRSLAWQISHIAGRPELQEAAEILDTAAKSTFGAFGAESVVCSLGCGEIYCSELCRARHFEDGGHRFFCLGLAESEEHELYQFRLAAYASGYNDELALAQKLLARIIADALQGQDEVLNLVKTHGKCWYKFSSNDTADAREIVQETWSLLQEAVPILEQVPAVDCTMWSKMIGFAVQCSLETDDIKSSLLKFAEDLKMRSPTEQLHLGNFYLDALQARRMQRQESDELDDEEEDEDCGADVESEENSFAGGSDLDEDDAELPLELPRFIAEPELYLPCLHGLTLPVGKKGAATFVRHSCVPSINVKWTCTDEAGLEGDLRKTWLTAEQDTLCYVDRSLPYEERREDLEERDIKCSCARCKIEGAHDFASATASADLDALRVWFKQAQQDSLHKDALRIADAILARDPLDIVALYDKARILSWSDRWTEAHEVRKFAVAALEAAHEGASSASSEGRDKAEEAKAVSLLRRAVRIHELYTCSKAQPMEVSRGDTLFERVALESQERSREVWISQASQPVMPKDKCRHIIEEAEAYAASHGGWTSSRHYAVPTTDLEVCNLEFTSEALIEAFESAIYPALALQFGVDPASIRTIDAFLVKYEAYKQSFLPVHSDESQFSITLALNEPSEYEGGGTWFPGLGRSLNAEAGGMVSFPGNVVHGGKAVSQGTRYIIAVFLFASTLETTPTPAAASS